MGDSIKLNNMELVVFDKENKEHLQFLKNIAFDQEIKKYFQGFLPNLLSKSDTIFDKGFFASVDGTLVGYIDFGKYNEDERTVYIREAVAKEFRGKRLGYGKMMIKEASDYLFENYDKLDSVRAIINSNNTISQNTIFSVGGYSTGNDYYQIDNPHIDKRVSK